MGFLVLRNLSWNTVADIICYHFIFDVGCNIDTKTKEIEDNSSFSHLLVAHFMC